MAQFKKNQICYAVSVNNVDKITIIKDIQFERENLMPNESILVYSTAYGHNVYIHPKNIFLTRSGAKTHLNLLKKLSDNRTKDAVRFISSKTVNVKKKIK